jgi:hypothetical protein
MFIGVTLALVAVGPAGYFFGVIGKVCVDAPGAQMATRYHSRQRTERFYERNAMTRSAPASFKQTSTLRVSVTPR